MRFDGFSSEPPGLSFLFKKGLNAVIEVTCKMPIDKSSWQNRFDLFWIAEIRNKPETVKKDDIVVPTKFVSCTIEGFNGSRCGVGIQLQLGYDLFGYSSRHDRLQDSPNRLQLFRAKPAQSSWLGSQPGAGR
mgnify:CR=1 FL=1